MAVDTNILISLHGSLIGLNVAHDLLIDGKLAVANPNSPANRITWSDDFLGDAINTQYNFQEGSDTAADFAISVQKGGVARLSTAASATLTMAVNGAQVDLGALNWYASSGGLSMEVRLKCDAVTTLALFIGFTDQTSALEMPWTLFGTTFTSNQSDGFGFLFDTAATTDTIRCVGVAADVDVTTVDTSDAWAAATYKKFRLECDTAGTVKYYIDGVLVATIALAVTPTVALVPYIGGFARAASARNIDIDYLRASVDRA